MPQSNFSVIIPNFNGQKFITPCLTSLFQAIRSTPQANFEVILVDNGSTDDSVQLFIDFFSKKCVPNLRSKIYQLSTNFGFASAVNTGIIQSKYPWVALLNNDLTMDPDWFIRIIKAQQNTSDPQVATFCGTVLDKEGTHFESQGLSFDYRGKSQNISNGRPFLRSTIYDLNPYYIWGSSAALVAYRKEIIQKIGLFDEDFFAYEEDVDLALRLHKLGYKTLYIPQAISYHLGGGTSSRMGNFRHRMDAKNWIYIILKNYSLREIITNLPAIIDERFRLLFGLIIHTKSIMIIPTLFSISVETVSKLSSMLSKRRQFFNLLKSVN